MRLLLRGRVYTRLRMIVKNKAKLITSIGLTAVGLAGALALVALPASATAAQDSISAREKEQARIMIGQVTDGAEAPISGAVVYLKNTKTLAVKTYITDDKGAYRFHALSPNADYEVYAEFQSVRSKTKSLSSFDSRSEVTINLHIDKK